MENLVRTPPLLTHGGTVYTSTINFSFPNSRSWKCVSSWKAPEPVGFVHHQVGLASKDAFFKAHYGKALLNLPDLLPTYSLRLERLTPETRVAMPQLLAH